MPKAPQSAASQTQWMLSSHSRWRVAWDVLIFALLAYLMIIVPYRIAFMSFSQEAVQGMPLYYFENCIDGAFLLDIAVNFRTGLVQLDGDEILDPKTVALQYLRTWFAIDLLSSVPTAHIDSRLMAIKLVAKFPRLVKLVRDFHAYAMARHEDWLNRHKSRSHARTRSRAHMLAFAHTRTRARRHARTHGMHVAHTDTFTNASTNTRACIRTHARTHAQQVYTNAYFHAMQCPARTHVHTHVCTHARMHARTHACTHLRRHAVTHACTHPRTHARTG